MKKEILFFLFLVQFSSPAWSLKGAEYTWVGMGVGYMDSHPELFDGLKTRYGLSRAQATEYNVYSLQAGYQFKSGWRIGSGGSFYNTFAEWKLSNKRMYLAEQWLGILVGRRFIKTNDIHGGIDTYIGLGESNIAFFGEDVKGWTKLQFAFLEPLFYLDIPFLFMEGALSFQVGYRVALPNSSLESGDVLGKGTAIDNCPTLRILFNIGNFRNRKSTEERDEADFHQPLQSESEE